MVHSRHAKQVEMMDYKKLKRVIKGNIISIYNLEWQVQANPVSTTKTLPSPIALPAAEVPVKVDTNQVIIANITIRKKQLQGILHVYQKNFQETHGRSIKSAQDIRPLRKEYEEYKVITFFSHLGIKEANCIAVSPLANVYYKRDAGLIASYFNFAPSLHQLQEDQRLVGVFMYHEERYTSKL